MFSPLGLPLAQALPASIQQKLGLPQQPQGQNASENSPTSPLDSGSFPGFNPAMAYTNASAEPTQPPATGVKIPLKQKFSQLLHLKSQPEALPYPDQAAPNPLLPPEAIEYSNQDGNTPGHALSAKLKQWWPFHRSQSAGQDGALLNPEPWHPEQLNPALLNQDGSPAELQPQAKGIMQAIPGKLGRLLKKKPRPNQQETGQPLNPALNPEGTTPENLPQNHPAAGGKQNGPPNQAGAAPPQRMTAPPGWKPGQGIAKDGSWGKKIEPLTVDQIFERKAKGWVVRAPKYTIKPDEIRVNYIRKQQECLENMIFALPWKDHDVINPFHTGPCNVTD